MAKSLDFGLPTVRSACTSGVDPCYSVDSVCGVVYSLTEVVKRLQPVILTLYAFYTSGVHPQNIVHEVCRVV